MNPKFYKEYYHLERNHWWFTARIEILRSTIQNLNLANQDHPIQILNAGVATGATSEMLSEFGNVTSLEYDSDCCDFLEEKTNIKPIRGSLTDLPFEDGSFDLVCAFDVIEHIEDDTKACEEMARVMNNTGRYIVTVPAYEFLWSNHDVINHHFRRYTKTSLLETLDSGYLHNKHSTYFNTLLFLPIAVFRLIQRVIPTKKHRSTSGSDNEIFKHNKIITQIFHSIFSSENRILQKGIKMPFGISLISIGTKK